MERPQKTGMFHLFGLSKTDGVVAQVVDAVPAAQESITQNGQRANRLGEVHAHKRADAGALDLENVVVGSDGEVVASQGEGQVGQVSTLVTVDSVLAVPGLLGANLRVPTDGLVSQRTPTREAKQNSELTGDQQEWRAERSERYQCRG